MSLLNESSLPELPDTVARPPYDRRAIAPGIVHIGPGAFHRAHQAWYVERLLGRDPRWGICGVSLRNADVRDALKKQDNLYTLAIRDEQISCQVIGVVRELLVAPEDPEKVLQRMCAPSTHIVTITVTEKGYCLAGDGSLDLSHPSVRHDLLSPHRPDSVVGFLAEALRRRKEARIQPFTVLSCDNLSDNGRKLARATTRFAHALDPSLAGWIENEVSFPRTMVDSITPASTDALRGLVKQTLGFEDLWPVQREGFVQWVIETGFRGTAPDWESVGVTLTQDVAGYERAKLRLLNAAHSTLAYAGLLAGYRTVAEATRDEHLYRTLDALMTDEVLPSLQPPAGLDLHAYIRAILARFRNPNMQHELQQIAMDGTQKLPIRILATVRENLRAGRPIDRLCVPLAAWMHFIRRCARRGEPVNDPLAPRLIEIGKACTGSGASDVPRFLALVSVFPEDLRNDPSFTQALVRAYDDNEDKLT